MAKKVDITEKLELDENPCLIIQGEELEVNADAATVLKIMGMFKDAKSNENVKDAKSNENGMSQAQYTLKMYNLIFPPKSQKLIEKKKLSFADLQRVIEAAMDLIHGDDEPEGEDQTRTTT